MSTDDIKAAAERLLRYVNHMYPREDALSGCIDSDTKLVADAYLAELDDTPIDEEWAAAVRTADVTLTRYTAEYWELQVFCDDHSIVIAAVVARGQVQSLLRAMGVKHE